MDCLQPSSHWPIGSVEPLLSNTVQFHADHHILVRVHNISLTRMQAIPAWVWLLAAALLGVMTAGTIVTVAKRHVLFDFGKMLLGA